MEQAIERGDFDLLAGLEDRGAQTLLREVDQKDLVTALKYANTPVRERFLGYMSARVRGFLESEIERSKAAPSTRYGARSWCRPGAWRRRDTWIGLAAMSKHSSHPRRRNTKCRKI